MLNGISVSDALALERVEKCRLALATLVLNAGGEIRLTPYDLGELPVGVLQVGWTGNDLEIRYTPQEGAPPLGMADVLSLAVLVHKAGGKVVIKGADTDRMPNGQLGHVIDGDDIVWMFLKRKEPVLG